MRDYSDFLKEREFAIFLFHGVISKNKFKVRNYTNKHLDVGYFEQIIAKLRSKGNPVSLDQFLSARSPGNPLPKNSYHITFDDGFANNFHLAMPILEKYDTPATFYITTGFVQNNDSSWTDLIEHAIEALDTIQLKHKYLNINSSFSTLDEKITFLDKVRNLVKNNKNIDPYLFAHDLWTQNKIKHLEPDWELDQKMKPSEIKQLSEHPLFTIGGHGHTHRILSFLKQTDLLLEVSKSLSLLENWTKQKITHYSYPEGLLHCYTEKVIDCLKTHGVKCCPNAVEGLNNLSSNLFHLKRISVT